VLGALGHVSGQLLVAWLVVVRHPGIWLLLPFFLLFAMISGIVNGLAAHFLLNSLAGHAAFRGLKERLDILTGQQSDLHQQQSGN